MAISMNRDEVRKVTKREIRRLLPVRFFRTDNIYALIYLAHGLALWLGFGSLAILLIQTNLIQQAYLMFPLVGLLIILSGLGLAFMGILGHEGFHGNLHTNRSISMLLGIGYSSVVPLYSVTGYSVTHWQHHLKTNSDHDPDYVFFSSRNRILKRVLNGPLSVYGYFTQTIRLIIDPARTLKSGYPFSDRRARVFAIVNILLCAANVVAFGYLLIANPLYFVLLVAAPYFVASFYVSMLPYMEHGAIDPDAEENTRSYTSKILTVIFKGMNYHREHHLFPTVQMHKLPELHEFLKRRQLIPETAHVVPGLLGAIRAGLSYDYRQ